MNKKEKLLNSLDSLEMSFKKKQEFVNVLVGDSGSNESTMEYLDISGVESVMKNKLLMTAALLVNYSGAIGPLATFIIGMEASALDTINYIAVDFNVEIVSRGGKIIKLKDLFPDSDFIPRITKEEFYNLNSDSN